MFRVTVEVQTIEQANTVMKVLETSLEQGEVEFETLNAEPVKED